MTNTILTDEQIKVLLPKGGTWNDCARVVESATIAALVQRAGVEPNIRECIAGRTVVGYPPEAITKLQARIEALSAEAERLKAEVDDHEAALSEAERGPWPEWAAEVLKAVRQRSGYDGFDDMDGIDIPAEVNECLIALDSVIGKRTAERDQLRSQLEAQGEAVPQAWTNLLAYVLQDDMHNRLTPRVVDIAYTAFCLAKAPNKEDGGASDWFNDTKPKVAELIEKLRKDLCAELDPAPAAPVVEAMQLADDFAAAAVNHYSAGESDKALWQKMVDARQALETKLMGVK